MTSLLDRLETACGSLSDPDMLAMVRQAYASPGATIGDAYVGLLRELFAPLGLPVIDASHPALRRSARPVLRRALERAGAVDGALRGRAAEIQSRGFTPQVDYTEGLSLVFTYEQGLKRRLQVREAAQSSAIPAELLSPNVLLRPIVEDALFPTLSYVSGPNELAYLAQLRGVYDHFGVPMPLVYPRASATVLDSASARFLAKYDLPFEALQAQDESALNRVLAAALPESVDQALGDADAAVNEKLAAVIAAVPAVDATLEGTARSTLGKIQHDLATLRSKVINAAKKRDETLRRQFHRAQAQAFPDGVPQERALGSIALLNRYGFAFVDRLNEELPLEFGHHWVLTL